MFSGHTIVAALSKISGESTNSSLTRFFDWQAEESSAGDVRKKRRLVSSHVELLRKETVAEADANLTFDLATSDMEPAISGAPDDDLGAVTTDDAALAIWFLTAKNAEHAGGVATDIE